MSGFALAGGFAADRVFGDPARHHPVAGFGQLASTAEDAIYAPSRVRGAVYAAGLVGAAAAGGELLARLAGRRGRVVVLAAVTWAALGGRSLTRVADALADDVARGDLDAARAMLPSLCGRDASALDAGGLSRAALESVAENTSDAVVGALFWGAVAGPAGVCAFRAANTLDAMVGHHNERYEDFGWASARLDDALGWPAARLGAGLTALCSPLVGGRPDTVLETVLRDGGGHPSPNAGQVESAFAGALGVTLGGPLAYAGRVEIRPTMGDGPGPTAADVHRATRLSLAVGTVSALVCALLRTLITRLHSPRPVSCHTGWHPSGLGAGGTR